LTGSLRASIAGSVHDDLVAVVSETVECALGEDGIIEEGNPLFDGAVGGDDGRSSPVSLNDDLIEVAGLLSIEAAESEVIDDEEFRHEQAAQDSLGGVVGTRLVDGPEQVIAAQEEDAAAGPTGSMPQCARERGFSHADRAEEDHALATVEKAEAEEVTDAVAIEADRDIPIEFFKGLLLVEAGPLGSVGEILSLAPIDFVLEREFEKVERCREAFCAYAARSGRTGTRPDSLSRFRTALSEGLTSIMIRSPFVCDERSCQRGAGSERTAG
jgi:hypothetical protein